jgi:signal peptidase II
MAVDGRPDADAYDAPMAGWWLPLSLAASVLADQSLKALAVRRLGPLDRPREVALGSALRIRPVLASSTVAGRLGAAPALLVAAWAGCLAVLLLAAAMGGAGSAVAQAGWGAALGGALGNLIDVVARGRVVDYVAVRWWPAFNLADAAIVAGIVIALAAR